MQVTDVTKPLGSVGKICEAGNRVVFEPDSGYIQNIQTGKKTPLVKEGKVYKLKVWVKARHKEDELMEVESEEASSKDSSFSWQGAP